MIAIQRCARHAFAVAILGLSLGLSGCYTIHTASVFGHDSLKFPTQDFESAKPEMDAGIVVKALSTPNLSAGRFDLAVQGGIVNSVLFPVSSGLSLSLGMGASGYYAENSRSFYNTTGEQRVVTFMGYGFTGQLKPTCFLGMGKRRFTFGGDFVYDKEFGDYLAYRNTLPSIATIHSTVANYELDFSPYGQTFSGSFTAGYASKVGSKSAIAIELAAGLCYPDFLYDAYSFEAFSATVSYTCPYFWGWASVELLSYSDFGIGLGLGFRIP
ncbi:MAG TPA: hypothetical protein PKO22_02045 [Treponemataceae bacterium]|mgnify:CR=1 FL=1|nr:hypothetical protein [Treponemataceae bacterium]